MLATQGGRQPWHGDNEVFESSIMDEVLFGCVLERVSIVTLTKYRRTSQTKRSDHLMFSRCKFDAETMEPIVKPGTRRFCVCQQPENPGKRHKACTHASCQRQVTQSLRLSFGSCHDHRMLARRPTHGAVRPMRHVVPRRCDFTVPVHWLPATCAPHHVQHRSAQISSMACCQQ